MDVSCSVNDTASSPWLPRRLPCKELCENVRDSCSGVLSAMRLEWPSFLSCDSFPTRNSFSTTPGQSCLGLQLVESATCTVNEFRCHRPNQRGSEYCLPSSVVCDGIDHCEDGSDEQNCTCEILGRFSCGFLNQCVAMDKRCDAHDDCRNGADESGCGTCRDDEMACRNYTCIEASKWCDGVEDCPSGCDEERCTMLVPRHQLQKYIGKSLTPDLSIPDPTGILVGYHQGAWSPVCAYNWSPLLSHIACDHMNFRQASHAMFTRLRPKQTNFIYARGDLKMKSIQEYFAGSGPCPESRGVHLTCQPTDCGRSTPADENAFSISPKIFGGRTARMRRWKWAASLGYASMKHTCGAALVHPKWLVSAAHCFQGRRNISIWRARFASADEENGYSTVNISIIIVHPRFDPRSMDFDIALVQLNRRVAKRDMRPICHPEVPPTYGAYCYIAGWGVTENSVYGSHKLQEGSVHVVNNAECQKLYPKHIITNRMICAGHSTNSVDSCRGDSGGPMMCWLPKHRQWHLFGVTSWGSACSLPGAVGVYTNVAYFSDWIRRLTQKEKGL